MSNSTTTGRLSRDDWVVAALKALGECGPAAVAVEPIALSLGATKGSFYWHFQNRQQLLEASLDEWERTTTQAVIDEVGQIVDPHERLRALFARVIRDDKEMRREGTILASLSDPIVSIVVRRVTDARLGFLRRAYVDCGHSTAVASTRARIAYATYVGHIHLAASNPEGLPRTTRGVGRYVDELAATIGS